MFAYENKVFNKINALWFHSVFLLVEFPRKLPLHGDLHVDSLVGLIFCRNSWKVEGRWDEHRDKMSCHAVAAEASEEPTGGSESGLPFREIPVEKMGVGHCIASLHYIFKHWHLWGGGVSSLQPGQFLGRSPASVLKRGAGVWIQTSVHSFSQSLPLIKHFRWQHFLFLI